MFQIVRFPLHQLLVQHNRPAQQQLGFVQLLGSELQQSKLIAGFGKTALEGEVIWRAGQQLLVEFEGLLAGLDRLLALAPFGLQVAQVQLASRDC